MRTRELVVMVVLVALTMTQVACYNKHFISPNQLAKLEARVDQKEAVSVIIDGCDAGAPASSSLPGTPVAQAEETASDAAPGGGGAPTDGGSGAGGGAEGGAAPVEGIDPETGCPTVVVNTSSPLNVLTNGGQEYRVTPFNFAVTDTQVVSPDYNLLLAIDDVKGAEVQTFSGLKTTALIVGALSVGVGLFVGIALTADEDRDLGQQ